MSRLEDASLRQDACPIASRLIAGPASAKSAKMENMRSVLDDSTKTDWHTQSNYRLFRRISDSN